MVTVILAMFLMLVVYVLGLLAKFSAADALISAYLAAIWIIAVGIYRKLDRDN